MRRRMPGKITIYDKGMNDIIIENTSLLRWLNNNKNNQIFINYHTSLSFVFR